MDAHRSAHLVVPVLFVTGAAIVAQAYYDIADNRMKAAVAILGGLSLAISILNW